MSTAYDTVRARARRAVDVFIAADRWAEAASNIAYRSDCAAATRAARAEGAAYGHLFRALELAAATGQPHAPNPGYAERLWHEAGNQRERDKICAAIKVGIHSERDARLVMAALDWTEHCRSYNYVLGFEASDDA